MLCRASVGAGMRAMTPIEQQVGSLARRHVDHLEGGGTLTGSLVVEVLDIGVAPATGRKVVRFLFDFLVRHGAQSGSDSYYHHVCVGTAAVVDGTLAEPRIETRAEVYVSEFEVEWSKEPYEREVLRTAIRAQWQREWQPAR